MFNVIAGLILSWVADILLLIYGHLSIYYATFLVGYLGMTIVVPVLVGLLLRYIRRYSIRIYGEKIQGYVKCPDCTSGGQLLGDKIPEHMFLDKGMDERGPFFQTRQANVHACRTCNGLVWIPTEVQENQVPEDSKLKYIWPHK